jgi:hypothetical protein
MILYRNPSWWAWAVTAALLWAGLAGWAPAFALAVLLSAAQVAAFRVRTGAFSSFPTQVRLAFLALLAVAFWQPWLFWLPAVGTLAQVLFGYCLLARALSLLPRNRRARMSTGLVWRTFTDPPRPGSVLQGLPAG